MTSAGIIHHQSARIEAPCVQPTRAAPDRDAEANDSPARFASRDRAEMHFLSNSATPPPDSALKQPERDEDDSQPVHSDLDQDEKPNQEERREDDSGNSYTASRSRSSGDEEDYGEEERDLYECMSVAQKIPQHVDTIFERWADRKRNMKRRLSKKKFTIERLRVEIDRTGEHNASLKKELEDITDERNQLSLKCTTLEADIREEKEEKKKEIEILRDDLLRETSTKDLKEREGKKVREELGYLQSKYQEEVSMRQGLQKECISTREKLSKVQTSFSEKEQEYKSRLSLEEAKVSELSDYNDSMIQKARLLEEIISESKNTVSRLRTESNEMVATLNTFHEWYGSPRRHDSNSFSLESLVQDIRQRRDNSPANGLHRVPTELSLPVPQKSIGTSASLPSELSKFLDLCRGLILTYGKREEVLSTLIKEILSSRGRFERLIVEPLKLIEPAFKHITQTKANVKEELTKLRTERETVSEMLSRWNKQLGAVHSSYKKTLLGKEGEIERVRAELFIQKQQCERNEHKVEDLEGKLQQYSKWEEDSLKKSHDLEVCRTVLAETRKDFAKMRQDMECLKIIVEQKDIELEKVKTTTHIQSGRMQKDGEIDARSQDDQRGVVEEKAPNKITRSSDMKRASTSRLRYDKKKGVRSVKQSSTITDRERGGKGVRSKLVREKSMEGESVDEEDWFEDQETTETLMERETVEHDERGCFSVRIPPRMSERKIKKSITDNEHFGAGKKRKIPKSSSEASKSKRIRDKHM
ncbi:unnamed protein product [Agarophyton chilense]